MGTRRIRPRRREPPRRSPVRRHVEAASNTRLASSSRSALTECEIFESATELTALVMEIGQHVGPVELVLLGDFLDLQRMGQTGQVTDRVTATLTRPDYAELLDALRAFRSAAGHRVTYVVGNHDAELWRNVRLQDVLRDAGLVDEFALRTRPGSSRSVTS